MLRMAIVGGLVVAVLAVGVYRAKLGAEETEAGISKLEAQIEEIEGDISVLKAEEAYLSRPERIGPMARERLGLSPAAPEQYTAGEMLSRRLGEERIALPQPRPTDGDAPQTPQPDAPATP